MKELEHEYQNAIDLDAPDLWSRIEAGVDAYEAEKKKEAGPEAVGVTAQTTQTVEQEAQPAEEVKTQTTAKKKSGAKLVYLYRFGAIAAAMFFLFIVVRAVNLNRTGTTNETASEAPMQEASEATMEEAAEEPMYEESSDMAMEEASEAPMEEAESEAMMEATADETAQEAAEEAPDLSLSGDNRETDGTYGKKSDSTNASSAAYAADTLDVLLGCKPEDMDPVLSVLSDLGIEDATDYCYSEDVPKSLLESMRNDAKTNAEAVSYRVIEFRDAEDDGMYRMVVKIIDDTDVELLAVVKNDGSEEMIYEAE